jgi:hypothetical protein
MDSWTKEQFVAEAIRRRDKAAALMTFPQLLELGVYPDGSGRMGQHLEWATKYMTELQEKIFRSRDFIRKHLATLAGLNWSFYQWNDADIEVRSGAAFGVYVPAEAIARLWPGSAWKRKRDEHPYQGYEQFDWIATIDGCVVRIDCAEKIQLEPVRVPDDGAVLTFGTSESVESEVRP